MDRGHSVRHGCTKTAALLRSSTKIREERAGTPPCSFRIHNLPQADAAHVRTMLLVETIRGADQVYGQLGETPPDVEDFKPLVAAFKATQALLETCVLCVRVCVLVWVDMSLCFNYSQDRANKVTHENILAGRRQDNIFLQHDRWKRLQRPAVYNDPSTYVRVPTLGIPRPGMR